jgi:hypothetical protein
VEILSGMFRFRTIEEAGGCVEAAMAHYEHHGCFARALAGGHFDAPKVLGRVLDPALT